MASAGPNGLASRACVRDLGPYPGAGSRRILLVIEQSYQVR